MTILLITNPFIFRGEVNLTATAGIQLYLTIIVELSCNVMRCLILVANVVNKITILFSILMQFTL